MTRKKEFLQLMCVSILSFLLFGCRIKSSPDTPISYDTSCGQGGFSYEPYPASYDLTLPSTPPTMSTNPNGHCLSPGSTFTAWPVQERYPDLISITKVELVIYHMRIVDHPNGKYWSPKQDPEYYQLNFSYNAGTLSASIPNNLSGVPPTAADIRLSYENNNGYSREVLFEDGRGGSSEHVLFFVPDYEEILAAKEINIGWDAFSRTMTDYTFPGFPLMYPRGWERYCKLRHASIHDVGFPGTAKFFDAPLSTIYPNHRYFVYMPAGKSGHFTFNYQIVCPVGLEPSGSGLFSSWGVMGPYTTPFSGSLPDIWEVTYAPNSWWPPQSPYNQ